MVVLSTDAIPQIRMTVDEYMEAILPEGTRYELVEGAVEMSPVPETPHDLIIQNINRLFVLYAHANKPANLRVTQKSAVVIPSKKTVREPDFAVYRWIESNAGKTPRWKEMTPVLVLEVVSPGQESRDYVKKRRDYWDAGIAEYWIAHPTKKILTVLTRSATDWVEQTIDSNGAYAPAQFPGLSISGIFAD
jgi:Uma2 family endonuclease